MKIYLAGPMTGLPRFNFDAFDHAAAVLRRLGHEVISPADMDREAGVNPDKPETGAALDFAEVMRKDLHCILDCDAVVMLPNWEQSNGARLERTVAESTGKAVFIFVGESSDGIDQVSLVADFPWTSNDIIFRAGRRLTDAGCLGRIRHTSERAGL